MASNKRSKYHNINAAVSPDVFYLANLLIEKAGLQKTDIVRIGLVKLANEVYPEVTSWNTYQLTAKALYAIHRAEEAEKNSKEKDREIQRLKAEVQSTQALIPDANIELIHEANYEVDYKAKKNVYEVAY